MNQQANTPLRVCYFGTYREQYGRNQIMQAGLRAQGVAVYVCHATLWQGIADRVEQAGGGWLRPGFWRRVVSAYVQLLRRHRRIPAYDVMLLGYPGVFDAFLGRLLSWRRRAPMALDHYMSLFLIAEERGLTVRSPISGRLILALEKAGLRLPDRLISDTAAYMDYHCRTYGLEPQRFSLVPAGADDRLFFPQPDLQPPADCFRVLYVGTFIPNHDAPAMVRAATLLQDLDTLRFDFYGEGPELDLCRHIAEEAELKNVYFHGWIEKEQLPLELAQAHLCLGAFGHTPQSCMTVQNKIWEAAAMARPILSGDSPTVREAFRHGEEIYLTPRGDPAALAEAIRLLAGDPALCERLAAGAYRRFQQGHSVAALGALARDILLDVRDGATIRTDAGGRER